MKKIIVTTFVLASLSGCGSEKKAVDIRTENRLNLSKITVGMTRAEVVQIMGEKTASANFGKNTVTVVNPYKSEVREKDGHTYEILYYYTHQDQKDWPFKRFKILDRELTPVVFEHGRVIGWGNEFLKQKTGD